MYASLNITHRELIMLNLNPDRYGLLVNNSCQNILNRIRNDLITELSEYDGVDYKNNKMLSELRAYAITISKTIGTETCPSLINGLVLIETAVWLLYNEINEDLDTCGAGTDHHPKTNTGVILTNPAGVMERILGALLSPEEYTAVYAMTVYGSKNLTATDFEFAIQGLLSGGANTYIQRIVGCIRSEVVMDNHEDKN